MAHHPSAKKRIRQTAKRTQINRARTSRIRTFIKKVELAVAHGDREAAQQALQGRRAGNPTRREQGRDQAQHGLAPDLASVEEN